MFCFIFVFSVNSTSQGPETSWNQLACDVRARFRPCLSLKDQSLHHFASYFARVPYNDTYLPGRSQSLHEGTASENI